LYDVVAFLTLTRRIILEEYIHFVCITEYKQEFKIFHFLGRELENTSEEGIGRTGQTLANDRKEVRV
jgi:hypothetical protein